MHSLRVPRTTVGAALAFVLASVGSLVAVTTVEAPPAFACNPAVDPHCVGVGTGSPGTPGGQGQGDDGSQGGTGQSSGGGPVKPDPCAPYPGALHQLCISHQGTQCLSLWDQYSGQLSVTDMNKMLTDNLCPAVAVGAAPSKSPGQLATEAADSFRLPDPSGDRSPSEQLAFHGHPFTYAGLWTWFWTDATQWVNCGARCTATARDGGNYATVTARPLSLTFDPGDGSEAVTCGSPGTPWIKAYGDDRPSTRGGCGYRYSTVTGPGYDNPVTSKQTITWQLRWTGSNNTSGTLTNRTTSTTGQLNVLQIQTVVTRR